ncbi:hypothetical protein AB0G74_28450 [Streptomyces sp. NPDC020875]|uniref:hypothetical protein n=1 Tax=Streptomyces sp. NPDC020875 TaxID=3154898 RepID=UPI0033FE1F2C
MAARKKTTSKTTTPAPCPECGGAGEIAETVRIGRKRRETGHRQTSMCPGCWGTGTA